MGLTELLELYERAMDFYILSQNDEDKKVCEELMHLIDIMQIS